MKPHRVSDLRDLVAADRRRRTTGLEPEPVGEGESLADVVHEPGRDPRRPRTL